DALPRRGACHRQGDERGCRSARAHRHHRRRGRSNPVPALARERLHQRNRAPGHGRRSFLMSFSSFSFLLFLPLVALVYAGARRFAGARVAQAFLLVASLVFYALPRPAHLPLLIASILFNWAVARRMSAQEDPVRRKSWLRLGLFAN